MRAGFSFIRSLPALGFFSPFWFGIIFLRLPRVREFCTFVDTRSEVQCIVFIISPSRVLGFLLAYCTRGGLLQDFLRRLGYHDVLQFHVCLRKSGSPRDITVPLSISLIHCFLSCSSSGVRLNYCRVGIHDLVFIPLLGESLAEFSPALYLCFPMLIT